MPSTFTPNPAKRGKAKWGQSAEVRNYREKAPARSPEPDSWWMRPEHQDRAAFQAEARKRHPSGDPPQMITGNWGSIQDPS